MPDGTLRMCVCGHDELDHGRLTSVAPHRWSCSMCECGQLDSAAETGGDATPDDVPKETTGDA